MNVPLVPVLYAGQVDILKSVMYSLCFTIPLDIQDE